jgi:O-antigen/teichoic acid export membrane protein
MARQYRVDRKDFRGLSEETPADTGDMSNGRLTQRLQSELARNTGWMLLSQLGLTVISGVYFILLARSLGVDDYGLFIAVAAFASILAPFGMFGVATLVMRSVARDRSTLAVSWGNGLVVSTTFGTALVLLMSLAGHLVLPERASILLIAFVAASDLVFANVHHIHGQMYLAVGNGRRTAVLQVLLSGLRLLFAIAFVLSGLEASAETWAYLYLASSVLATVIGTVMALRSFERPRLELRRAVRELRTGFTYAIGFSSMTVYNDIDKTMLARIDSTASAGAYAAGYRVVGIVMSPIFSLLHASFAGFFRHGARGVHATTGYALRLMPYAAGYGLFAGVVLYVVAPLAPILFGADFADSVETIRLLAVLPVIKAIQNLSGDALTGADHQGTRSALQVIIALVNVGLNLWLIPLYSFAGAVYATIVSDSLLLLLIWAALAVYLRRTPRPAQAEGS